MNFSKPAESNYGLVPEGEYDVIIKEAYENVHKTNGKPCINLIFTIRNDVDQECKNRNLFLTLWKKREPNADDMQADGYNYNQLKVLLSAARNSGTTSAPAQRPPEQFASQLKAADFEELVSDSDVPF